MEREDRLRRRANKQLNERLKLASGFFNTLGIATFVAAFLGPAVNGKGFSASQIMLGMGLAIVLHICGQIILTFWRSED